MSEPEEDKAGDFEAQPTTDGKIEVTLSNDEASVTMKVTPMEAADMAHNLATAMAEMIDASKLAAAGFDRPPPPTRPHV